MAETKGPRQRIAPKRARRWAAELAAKGRLRNRRPHHPSREYRISHRALVDDVQRIGDEVLDYPCPWCHETGIGMRENALKPAAETIDKKRICGPRGPEAERARTGVGPTGW